MTAIAIDRLAFTELSDMELANVEGGNPAAQLGIFLAGVLVGAWAPEGAENVLEWATEEVCDWWYGGGKDEVVAHMEEFALEYSETWGY